MKVIVVEDILPTLEHLVAELSSIDGVTVAGAFSRPSEAQAQLDHLAPDAAFLDVDLPGISGIELARRIHLRNPRTAVVFITAHSRFAVDAFSVEALDFLLKPIETADLIRSVERIRRSLESRDSVASELPTAQISMFGGFQVKDAQGVQVRWLSAKHEEFLAYLLLLEHPVTKWSLAEILWPDSDAQKSERNFDMALFRIRAKIQSHALPIQLVADKGRYRIQLGEGVQFDWNEVRSAKRIGTVAALEKAIRTLDQEFLAGADYLWTQRFFQYVLSEHRTVVLRLLALLLAQGRNSQAFEVLNQGLRQTRSDPTLIAAVEELLLDEKNPAVNVLFRRLLDES